MTHQVGVGEFYARALFPIVVQRSRAEFRVQLLAHGIACRVAALQIQDGGAEWRDGIRPDDAGLVVARLDHRADKPGDADAVAAHFRMHRLAVRRGDGGAHRLAVFGAEIEDVADLDAAAFAPARWGNLRPRRRIVLFVGRRIV